MKKIIKRTFKAFGQEKGNSFANTICQRMKNDPRFQLLMPYIDELKRRNTVYESSVANAADGGKLLTRLKNDDYLALIAQLDDIADQVELMAKGDELIALAAGFELIQAAKSINDITMPVIVKAENDPEHTGAAIFKLKVDKNAVNTGVEHQKEGDTVWQNGTFTTGSVAVVTGLQGDTRYNFRFYSNGRKGLQSDKTEPVSVLVS